MKAYATQSFRLSGTHWWQVSKKASSLYHNIKRKTRRKPYVRSTYFNKEKVFLESFWRHLHEKTNIRDKTRRLKYFPCAIELIENSKCKPTTKQNPNRKKEIVHRFAGVTPKNHIFYVQIKEDRKGQKWLMSIFPAG